ncbi:MAG: biotin/lipoyl-binding protein, partial [Cellvibrionaceae bacterium]|nr:biotin/lipoyl-binding protein [Cellvibrionaceae bacterium]
LVSPGQQVNEGDTIMILEAMKMETEVSAPKSGTVGSINVKEGDSVAVGDCLLTIA